jgi:hypothetical protein
MFVCRRARRPPSRITPSAWSGRTPQLKRDLLCAIGALLGHFLRNKTWVGDDSKVIYRGPEVAA